MATFVPRFLFEQFSQVAYFYFLVQVRTLQPPLRSVAHSADRCRAGREAIAGIIIAGIAQRSGAHACRTAACGGCADATSTLHCRMCCLTVSQTACAGIPGVLVGGVALQAVGPTLALVLVLLVTA